MKTSTGLLALAAALTSNVAAFPQYAETLNVEKRQDANAWQAPGAGDARTACPGLNTLANHGFINRNGRGISAQQMQQGFLDAFGFDFAITQAGAFNAINLQGNGQTFDLDTLNQPHQIEHDGSLSRDDLQMSFSQDANNHDFNCTIWGMTLDLYGPVDHVNYVSSNTARLGRVAQAQQQDFPGWFIENAGGSLAEHGFLLTSMNDMASPQDAGPQARLDWVDYWITNQRLPTELGWTKNAIANDYYNSVVSAVSAAATTVPAARATGGLCGNAPTSPSGSPTPSSSATSGVSVSATGSATATSYPSAPVYKNSSMPATPSATGSGSGSVTSAPVSVSPSTTDVAASVTSSAEAQATSLAGPPPALPNGYKDVLSKDQWNAVKDNINGYIAHVESIISALCGLQFIGTGNAPWYGSMGSGSASAPAPAPAPGVATEVTTVTITMGAPAPAGTCGCA